MNWILFSNKENFLKYCAITASALLLLSIGVEKSIFNFIHPEISLRNQRDQGKQQILYNDGQKGTF